MHGGGIALNPDLVGYSKAAHRELLSQEAQLLAHSIMGSGAGAPVIIQRTLKLRRCVPVLHELAIAVVRVDEQLKAGICTPILPLLRLLEPPLTLGMQHHGTVRCYGILAKPRLLKHKKSCAVAFDY